MTATREYFVIDAFATGRFTGNPAAVLPDALGLSDQQLQSIASEFNLSETAFITPSNESKDSRAKGSTLAGSNGRQPLLQFRWCTPTVEVNMCGHATVAGVHALVECGRLPWKDDSTALEVPIDTRSGRITAFVERWPGEGGGRMYWLELRPPALKRVEVDGAAWAKMLGLTDDAIDRELPIVRTQDEDLIVPLRDVMCLNQARPDMVKLEDHCASLGLRGVGVATTRTLTPSVHVQSRYFAPAAGVNEDPVTGSLHGPLCAYLVEQGLVPEHDGMAGMMCVQGIPGGRTGLVYGLVRRGEDRSLSVRVGGKAVTVMRGQLYCE